MPADAPELLALFADLVSLAAATHEHRAVLASLAGTDPLTGLGNRRTFDALLGVEVERAQRHDDLLSLVLLDIDHFKRVNDAFGHQAGDRALVEVGRRLAALARSSQVLVVTHLPQVAAYADRHVVVHKSQDGSVTTSGLVTLDDEGRERELSRMLAGLEDSDSARAHARELLDAAAPERACLPGRPGRG